MRNPSEWMIGKKAPAEPKQCVTNVGHTWTCFLLNKAFFWAFHVWSWSFDRGVETSGDVWWCFSMTALHRACSSWREIREDSSVSKVKTMHCPDMMVGYHWCHCSATSSYFSVGAGLTLAPLWFKQGLFMTPERLSHPVSSDTQHDSAHMFWETLFRVRR